MTRFLNDASKNFQNFSDEDVAYLEQLFKSFLDACSELPPKAFYGKSGAFTISVFDAVFPAMCRGPLTRKDLVTRKIEQARLAELQSDPEFIEASQSRTAGQGNVRIRLAKAAALLSEKGDGDNN